MVNLKQIKLMGFKSFPDKTTITMSEGVTCIVGPNGCGKSNVADAIRWVFGEQSAKTMRGSQMVDVIFDGTEKRRKQSFCEVTLVFDNTRRIFDVDADEVEMTRRLYRDGDSEYLLNRQPSRMRVLTNLLHGAGAAKEGYSIIGQGRIDQIMKSKPEDRRAIFEEATGIIVFKDRKAEAESKLAASKDNLRIFQSRLDEAERRLVPLSRQAENARKYTEIHNELRFHEINSFIYRTESSEAVRATLTAEAKELREKKDALKAHMEETASLESATKDEIAEADRTLHELNDRRLEYSVGAEKTNTQSQVFLEKASSVKDKLNAARDSITAYTAQITATDANIKREEHYRDKNSELLERSREKAGNLRKEIDAITDELSQHQCETGKHREMMEETYKELTALIENRGSVSAQRDFLEERVSEMEREKKEAEKERDEARKTYDELMEKQKELSALVDREDELINEAETALRSAEDKLRQLNDAVTNAKANLGTLRSQKDLISALRDRFEGYKYSVRNLLSAAKGDAVVAKKIAGLIADVVSCDEKYEVAIDTAFGANMQNVITETREDARDLIDYLKAKRLGQVTFFPMDAMKPRFEGEQIRLAKKERGAVGYAIDLVKYDKKYDGVMRYLLGNTLVCEDITAATAIAKAFPGAFRIVTLDGNQIAASGAMSGGSRNENASNLLANERQLKELEKQIADEESFLKKSAERRPALESARDGAEKHLEDLRRKMGDARVELSSVTERQNELMKRMNEADESARGYELSISELKERLGSLGTKYQDIEEGANKLSRANETATEAISDISGKYDELSARRDALNEDLNQLNIQIAMLESSVTNEEENIKRYGKEKEEAMRKMSEVEKSIPDLTKSFEDFSTQATRATLTDEQKKELDAVVAKIKETEDRKKELSDKQEELDAERRKGYDELDAISDSQSAKERSLQRLDDELESLRSRIEEEYGETYESCKGERVDGYDIEGSAAMITNLRRQQNALGPVNVEAIKEYEEENERHEKMLAEKEDLTKAIDDLTKALDEICTEMLRIFNEGFKVINDNFGRTFKELFGGGSASLQLVYEDGQDPLDAGVEINACPPGKKLSKITLLSGGEQALTAIAILFAIIQMRPMPFCFLDEIEAALDDANVGRYANYLKKFSEETQFIVITHRKPTMEVADTLFGVTMEEKGVSKIVSVKLSEVETRLGGDTVQ
ncbi:MAG: chromosome segregation protein SMC [Clostridia bacterium]|nr:chromosome segregation protein SMC [Clostridia bacterium]